MVQYFVLAGTLKVNVLRVALRMERFGYGPSPLFKNNYDLIFFKKEAVSYYFYNLYENVFLGKTTPILFIAFLLHLFGFFFQLPLAFLAGFFSWYHLWFK